MRKVGWLVVIAVIFSLFLFGCQKVPESWRFWRPKERRVEEIKLPPEPGVEEGTLLAKIEGRTITLEEFNQRIETLPDEIKKTFAEKPEAKRDFLDELINRELIIKEALDRQLDADKEVVKLMEAFRDQLLYETLIAKEMGGVKVSSAEVENFYNVYKEEFKIPEERRVKTIVVPTEEEAKSIMIELLKGADFATLARERSIGPNKANGGDLGFIIRKTAFTPPDKKTMFPQFEQAAFALDLGRISSIVKGPDGYYLIKLEEKKEAKQRTLYEVWDELEKGVLMMKQRQTLTGLVDNLRKKAKEIEVREELLKSE